MVEANATRSGGKRSKCRASEGRERFGAFEDLQIRWCYKPNVVILVHMESPRGNQRVRVKERLERRWRRERFDVPKVR